MSDLKVLLQVMIREYRHTKELDLRKMKLLYDHERLDRFLPWEHIETLTRRIVSNDRFQGTRDESIQKQMDVVQELIVEYLTGINWDFLSL